MKNVFIIWVLLYSSPILAQEGFEADPMQPCIIGPGLAHACYPVDHAEGIIFGSAVNWAYHLLRVQDDEDLAEATWLVHHRLTMSMAMGFRYRNGLQLSAGLDWIAQQQGDLIDGLGAPSRLDAGIGRTWIEASYMLFGFRTVGLSLETGLVFPSPNPSILSSPGLARWKAGARLAADLWLFHPLVAIGVRFGENQNFRDIMRDNALYWDVGLELTDKNWSWSCFVEAYGISKLNEPFSSMTNDTIESLAGAKVKLFDSIEIILGLGMGIMGAGSPQIRSITIFRIIPEKISLENE